MYRPLLCCCCLWGGLTLHAAEEPREWTYTADGVEKKVVGRLEALVKGELLVRDAAGAEQKIPLASLSREQSKEALILRVGSGVVLIHNLDVSNKPAGIGSGFVITKNGFILTNYHVIRGAGAIEVVFRDHKEKRKAECLGVDRAADLAVLKVEELPADVHVVELAAKNPPRQGESVWTIGHPKQLKNTVSWGDVNAVRPTTDLPDQIRAVLRAKDDTRWIQTDAVLSHGSSGGPLLNPLGQAVGVNTFIMGPQLGFAVHVQHAKTPFQQAREATRAIPLPMPPEKHESALAWNSREVGPLLDHYLTEMGKLKAAANGLDPQTIQTRIQAVHGKIRPQLLQVAAQDPAGWPALQALLYTCSLSADGSEQAEADAGQACRLLIKHHGDSEEIGNVLEKLSALESEPIREFRKYLLEKSPHKNVQSQAAFMLGHRKLQWLVDAGGMDLAETQAARKEILALALKLDTDFKQVFVGQSTGAELAAVLRELLTSVPIGKPAQEISGVDYEGKTFKLSDSKGKVVLLYFFADWCPWCRKMYPIQRKMVETLKDKPFELLGVHCESQDVIVKLSENKTVTWRSWADGANGPIATAWQNESFPCLYLIDHNGIVRGKLAGAPTEEQLNAAIATLLKEMPATAK